MNYHRTQQPYASFQFCLWFYGSGIWKGQKQDGLPLLHSVCGFSWDISKAWSDLMGWGLESSGSLLLSHIWSLGQRIGRLELSAGTLPCGLASSQHGRLRVVTLLTWWLRVPKADIHLLKSGLCCLLQLLASETTQPFVLHSSARSILEADQIHKEEE